MTRHEGSVNAKPTKANIITLLKAKGIECKNDGVAIKKSVLEEMAKQAGINIYEANKPDQGKRHQSSIEACRVSIFGRNAAATMNNGDDHHTEDPGVDMDVTLNQVTGFPSTSFFFKDMLHSKECIECKSRWFDDVFSFTYTKDYTLDMHKFFFKVFRSHFYPNFECKRCEMLHALWTDLEKLGFIN